MIVSGYSAPYRYKCPTKRGYTKIKISKHQHNKIFKRKLTWRQSYDYYWGPNSIIMHRRTSFLAKLSFIMLLPVALIWYGFSGFAEIMSEIHFVFDEKSSGKFLEDIIWNYQNSPNKYYEKLTNRIINNIYSRS